MTNLTGTEKQIEWAEKIRETAESVFARIVVRDEEDSMEQFDVILSDIRGHVEAEYWINNRALFADLPNFQMDIEMRASLARRKARKAGIPVMEWYKTEGRIKF